MWFVGSDFFIVVWGALGLAVGSLLNAAEWRWARGQSLAWAGTKRQPARSHCPHCQHVLAARDLVPVLSYVWLRGRCRFCRRVISWQYPVVELAGALSYIVCAVVFADVRLLVWATVVCSVLLFVFVYDLKYGVILDQVMLPAIAFALVSQWLLGRSLIDVALGAAIAGGFFGLQFMLSGGRWIGAGDIRLGIFMGVVLGWQQVLVALMLAYISGAALAVVFLFRQRAHMQSRIAFGPFLAAATVITLFCGTPILQWYWSILL